MVHRLHSRLVAVAFCIAILCGASAEEMHWSLRPLTKPPLPSISDRTRVQTPIDVFIVAELERNGMTLSGPAGKRTLLRRLYFNLVGLPPTPKQVAEFLADSSPEAVRTVVDRLLESPHYGERWARHWLDLVHYAETHGHDQDRPRTNAWPYRDYVIAAFNSDKPYARFVQEQIAGDALFPNDPQATVALGFLATGPWDESSLRDIREDTTDRQVARYIDRDDIIATTMNTFMSTTAQCARCHNHKFDPISTGEYYNLQAVFAGTEKGNRIFDSDPEVHSRRQELLKRKRTLESTKNREALDDMESSAFLSRFAAWEETALTNTTALPDEIACLLNLPRPSRRPEDHSEVSLFFARHEVDSALAALPTPQLVFAGGGDFIPDGNHKPIGKPREVHVLRRGELRLAGDLAEPGALSCIPGLDAELQIEDPSDEASRRAALAKWITDPRNVLTWRSIVNRVWQYHFGRGLSSTPSDFGVMGEAPSHPELLDWLATWFLENGGSFKKLHRLILLSAVYQQSSDHQPAFALKDSDNRLLWRMNRSRLDAEVVRDTILAVSGKLDLTLGGPSAQQFVMSPGIHVTPIVDYAKFDVDNPASFRRAIYRFIFRTLPDPFMDALDCPDSSQLIPARNNSVTVLQALAMWNNEFVVRQSEHFAHRLRNAAPDDVAAQIDLACQLTLSRLPTSTERSEMKQLAEKHGLPNLCRVLFNSNEFMFVP